MQITKIRQKNKRGISLMVSYVMLIMIAITLSIIVFATLKSKLPRAKVSCPDGVSMVIKTHKCYNNDNIIEIAFQNKGFFDIDGVFVKASKTNAGKAVHGLTPVPEDSLNKYTKALTSSRPGLLAFGQGTLIPLSAKSNRNLDIYVQNFSYDAGGIKKVRIEPFVFGDEGEFIICESEIKTIDVECS